MTTSTVRILHCDFAGCTAQTRDDSTGHVPVRPDGWVSAIYTHGCPAHGEAIRTHQASITSKTSGRGSREKTTWFLTCACGWKPTPFFQTYTSRHLQERHLKHVTAVTA